MFKADETDNLINQLASKIVLLEEPELEDLNHLMKLAGAILCQPLATEISQFKTMLLDAATGQGSHRAGLFQKIREQFSSIQKKWYDLQLSGNASTLEMEEPKPGTGTGTGAAAGAQLPLAAAAPEPAASADAQFEEDPELLAGFIQEAREHLDSIEVNILEWEAHPADKEVINTIFRPFHTVKGMAGFLNLVAIQSLAHELENLLDAAREGRIQFAPELADLILKGVDALAAMIQEVEKKLQGKPPDGRPVPVQPIMEAIHSFLAGEVAGNPVPRMGAILIKEKVAESSKIKEALEKQSSGDGRMLGEILVEDNRVPQEEVLNALNIQNRKAQESSAAKSIKVDTAKMDALFDMVGELVITNNMLMQNKVLQEIKNSRINADLTQLKRITTTLQNVSLSIRMVPIGATFQKMRRVVYELTKKSGKKINLTLQGEATEIDRNLVDSLYDPLLHMVRNACDHGIEKPPDRLRAGKPEYGEVVLEAYQKGGYIFIEIRDDGAGMNLQKIRQKAIERNIIQPDDELDDTAMINLIFHPGFSTSENVTDVSGRGVGMDVVKRAVVRLGGRVEVQSEFGRGSLVTVKLPLTLAIIDGIVVMVGDERYILPTVNVKEAVNISRDQYNNIAGKGETVAIRGWIYPLIRIHDIFDIASGRQQPWEGIVVLAETESRDVALLVDEIIGKQEVVIKNLGNHFRDVRGVSGGAILGDGKVGLILDVNQLEAVAMEA